MIYSINLIYLIHLAHLIGCVILAMSLHGLQDHRNRMVTIETEWQTALCFEQGCFHTLGLYFYFLQSPKANALVD